MAQRTHSRPTGDLLLEGDEEHESRHALLVELHLVRDKFMAQRTHSRPTGGLLREGDEEHESRHALLVELQLMRH